MKRREDEKEMMLGAKKGRELEIGMVQQLGFLSEGKKERKTEIQKV